MFLDTERNAPPLNESISMTLLRYLYPEICSSNTDNTCAMTLSDHPKPATDYHLKTGQRE
jgi:hypothetical protein